MTKIVPGSGRSQLNLKWSDSMKSLAAPLREFLASGELADVSLASDDGHLMKAHRLILASRSVYFNKLFKNQPQKDLIVVLKDVNHVHLKAILDFMYKGEINIPKENLLELSKVGRLLKVDGLDDMINNVSGFSSLQSAERRLKLKERRKPQLNHAGKGQNGVEESSESDECSSRKVKKRISSLSEKQGSSDCFSEDHSNPSDSPKFCGDHERSTIGQIEPSRILEQSMATAEVSGKSNGEELLSFGSPNDNDAYEDEGMDNSLFDGNPIISLTENNTSDAMLLSASTSASQAATICVVYGQGGNSNSGDGVNINRSLKESRYECDVCRIKFASNYNLKRHLSTHEPDRPRWQCPHCEKSFTRRDSLPKHIAFAHKDLTDTWTKEHLALGEEN